MKQKKKNQTVEVKLIFDNKNSAGEFVAQWLDSGMDGGGNLDWHTDYDESDQWDKRLAKFIRIKGTGKHVEELEDET